MTGRNLFQPSQQDQYHIDGKPSSWPAVIEFARKVFLPVVFMDSFSPAIKCFRQSPSLL